MKMLTIILLFFSYQVFSQEPSSAILTITEPAEAKKLAQSNIAENRICLFVQGGFAPSANKSDLDFEKKYKVNIRDFGCTAINPKVASAYNREIFAHLDSKYGAAWKKEVRSDIIGLNPIKKKK